MSSPSIQSLDLIPPWEPINQWLSTEEFARLKGRSVRTVRHWCLTGSLRDFNIPFRRDRHGRWWIKHVP
jgi:hypothetical protein